MTECPSSSHSFAISLFVDSQLYLPILCLSKSFYIFTSFAFFLLPSLSLSLSPPFSLSVSLFFGVSLSLSPSPSCSPFLPPGHRMKAGEAAPRGSRDGERYFYHSIILLSLLKSVTFFTSTRTKLHGQYAKFTTPPPFMFAENSHPLGCGNQQT